MAGNDSASHSLRNNLETRQPTMRGREIVDGWSRRESSTPTTTMAVDDDASGAASEKPPVGAPGRWLADPYYSAHLLRILRPTSPWPRPQDFQLLLPVGVA